MSHIRLAEWVLTCAAAPADREAAIGDLAEEYAIRAGSGSAVRAGFWYWNQVARSIPSFFWTPLRTCGFGAALAVALAACMCEAVLELGIRSTIARLPPAVGDVRWVIASVLVVLSMAAVSFAAARIRPGASSVLAIVAFTAIAVQLLLRNGAGLTLPQELFAAVTGPGAAYAGGLLSWRVRL